MPPATFLVGRRACVVFKQHSQRYCSVKVGKLDGDEYQFLQRSYLPTYHFQKSLRRLPIPKLESTCLRFLNAVKAVYGDSCAEVKQTEKIVNEFATNEGPELQKALLAYDQSNRHTSYISEPWFDIYLRSRVPCPINYNPFMMFAPDPDQAYNDQLIRATNLAVSFGRFKKALDAECLEPEVFHMNPKKSNTNTFRKVCGMLPSNLSWFGAVAFKAFPLDMSQYPNLFGGTRIPQREKDRIHCRADSRHFLVLRNGTCYTVHLFDESGNLLPAEVVHGCLAKILESDSGKGEALGSLTTLDRDTWADVRVELVGTSERNAASMQRIDDALFALCMDGPLSKPVQLKAGEDHSELVDSLLCGGDGSNRWFDKCFQLIVNADGMATINFEHSWGDGVAVLRLMEESLRDTTRNRFVHAGDRADMTLANRRLSKLEWDLNDSLRARVVDAQKRHVAQASRLEFGTVEYPALNRENIKRFRLSPDSVMQLAIQLAFYRMYKEFVPTYESCSTAAFKKGRTECIRSATLATRSTILALEDKCGNGDTLITDDDAKELYKQMQMCSETHMGLVKDCSMGQGFDRHLLGLRLTAERLQMVEPALFRDTMYARMCHFILSTSTLSTDTIVFGGFGPVVDDGFGIGYNVVESKLGAVVASYKDKRSARKFCDELANSLDILYSILSASKAGETNN